MKLLRAIREVSSILRPQQRAQFRVLLVLILVDGLIEMVGIASIMPFMAVVVDPALVFTRPELKTAYETFGFSSVNRFLVAFGVVVLAFLAFGNAFGVFTRWRQNRTVWAAAHEIATRLLRGYASRPYEFFLSRNSTEMNKHVLSEVGQFVNNVVSPALDVTARLVVITMVFGLLLVVNAGLATIALAVVGGVYGVIYLSLRTKLRRMGAERNLVMDQRFKTAAELLSGIKPVKIQDCEAYFVSRFEAASSRFAFLQSRYLLMGELPRHLVEVIAFGGVIGAVLYFIGTGHPFQTIVPLLSLYAVAAYRLLPSAQKMYVGFTNIRYHYPIVAELVRDLDDVAAPATAATVSRMGFSDSLRLRGLSFSYVASTEPVLKGLNLVIPARSHAAFVGPTGSGKSTLVDLLTGLLSPTEGEILIDGRPLTRDNAPAWRAGVGYVPQDVFLIDDTITRNIAFGVSDQEVDRERVRRVAGVSHIAEFIETQLPRQYDTLVGERGVRLSGGQRQRIGLARALYREPSVLILDEATSALDGITEREVMGAIAALPQGLTAIMIAHRLSTVRHCERIWLIEDGRITAEGTYDQLSSQNTVFQQMARLTT